MAMPRSLAPLILLLFVSTTPVARPVPYGDNLQEACNKTLFPKVCIQSLMTNPETRTADARRLAELSVYVAKEVGTTVAAFAHHELNGVKEDILFKCLDSCSGDIEEAVAHLSALTRELTDAKFLEVKSWLSATLGGSSTCEDSCKDAPISEVKNAVVTKSLEFEKLLRVTLDLITEASDYMSADVAVSPTAWEPSAPDSYGASVPESYDAGAPDSYGAGAQGSEAPSPGAYGASGSAADVPSPSSSISSAPSYGAADAPSSGAAGAPSYWAADAPSSGAAGAPSYGAADAPSYGAADAPSSGAAGAPSYGAADAPSSEAAGAPSYEAAGAPWSMAAGAPSYRAVGAPSSRDSDAPSYGAAGAPSSGDSDAPSYGAASAPSPGDADAPSPSSGASAPEADTTA